MPIKQRIQFLRHPHSKGFNANWGEVKKREWQRTLKNAAAARMRRRRLDNGVCPHCGEKLDSKFTSCLCCKEKIRLAIKRNRLRVRLSALEAYGGAVCSCCGETQLDFLALDHITGNGGAHRKTNKQARNGIFGWLKKHKYPPGFRVLCHNCNWSARLHKGVCVHALNAAVVTDPPSFKEEE